MTGARRCSMFPRVCPLALPAFWGLSGMWRRISKEAATEIAKEVAKTIALWAIPPGIGLIGWLQDVPWFYLTVGVILSGAGIMTWLVQLDEWRSRNRVEHKLGFVNMRTHLTQNNNTIVAIKFGFHMQNRAAFPINFRIENMQTNLNLLNSNQKAYPPSKPYPKTVFTISPGGIGWFDDHDIILPKNFIGDTTAELKCEVDYGKAGRFDHKLEINKYTQIHFNGPGISGGQHWYDQ